MIVDLSNGHHEETGVFQLRGGGTVQLRLLSAQDLRDMRKACVSVVPEYPKLGDGKDAKYVRFEAQRFNEDLWDEMQWDRVITGWADLYDKHEKPIPVTTENKRLLMDRVPEFAQAVRDGLKALQDAEKARVEGLEKNSSTG